MSVDPVIFDKVKEELIDALGVDDDEVTEEATMVGDLGAESIDFLDIVFKLEKAFDISIPREELFPDDILTNAEFVVDGKLTDEGMAKLEQRMPFADLEKFKQDPQVQNFGNQLTVKDLCKYVAAKKQAA
jgi:acyl carrier protein